MPPSSHSSLFKQRRRQKLRLVLFLFAMIPLIFELKSHYYYYRPFEENGGVPRRHRYQHHHQSDGHMEHQLQQLSSSFELPTFLAGEEEAMKYIERHGKKVEEEERTEDGRKAHNGEDGSRHRAAAAAAAVVVVIATIINRIRNFTTCI